MMSVSTLAMSSALAPAALKQRAETSEERKPRVDAHTYLTASRSVSVMTVGVTPTKWPS